MSQFSSIGQDYAGRSSAGSLSHTERIARYDRTEATDSRQLSEDAGRSSGGDRVELSAHARYLATLREMPSVRAERIESVREALQDPNYINDERLNIAISRLLEDL